MAVQSNWSNTDYYAVLGVADNASEQDIRRAYRRLARELHPDTNPDPHAERRFKEVAAAHEVLGDADRRREYDEFRRLGPVETTRPTGFRTGGTRIRVNNIDTGDGLHDLFGGLFGSGGVGGRFGSGSFRSTNDHRANRGTPRPPGGRRGADISATLSVPLLDAVNGSTATVSFVSDAICDACGGSGRAPGGSGVSCRPCGGSGRVTKPRSVHVPIPAGVEHGQTIRLAEQGDPGRDGGPAGDLLLTVEVEPHPDFGRLGNHLTTTVRVTYPELVLGSDVTVPTIDGRVVTVRVPPGTPSGRTLRLKGRGIPGTDGDLLVTLDLVVPSNPTPRERELIEALAAAGEAPRARRSTTGSQPPTSPIVTKGANGHVHSQHARPDPLDDRDERSIRDRDR